MKQRSLLRLALFAIVCAAAIGAHAANINKGFFNKAAKNVWGMESENLFDPKTEIPEVFTKDNSAVYIASHDHFDTHRQEQNTIYTATGRTNRTQLKHTWRRMVKILDQSAVEDFSEFEFSGGITRRLYGIPHAYKLDFAFGARVHKPDGQIIDVDPSTALEISDGKKSNKNTRYKIAIPSLEPGDVLEYFFYTEYMSESSDIVPIDINLTAQYPIVHRLITGSFDPTLANEFMSYNGAPSIERLDNVKDQNIGRLYIANMPAVATKHFISEDRSVPFLRLNILNNYTPLGQTNMNARTSRNGGLYSNISSSAILGETKEYTFRIGDYMDKHSKPISRVVPAATKLAKDFAKEHPDATPAEIAGAAQMALIYSNLIAKPEDEIDSQMLNAIVLSDILQKLKIYDPEQIGLVLLNGRDDVPTEDIAKWNQTEFMVIANDTVYPPARLYYPTAPGEVGGMFQGETAICLMGPVKKFTPAMQYVKHTMPNLKYNGNRSVAKMTATVDGSRLVIDRDVTLSGSSKNEAADLCNTEEWIREAEAYLGVKKPYTTVGYDAVERSNELRRVLADECKANMGVTPDSITSFEVRSRGIMPGKADMEFSLTCHIDGLVEDAGDNIFVSVGKLLGSTPKLEGSERERLIPAFLMTAFQETNLLTLKVPEGYQADESSLADINRNAVNPLGLFNTNARINDDGDVEIQRVLRIKYADIPVEAWPKMLELYDAAALFQDASIALTKK